MVAQQRIRADAATRRQDRADFEGWNQLNSFPNLWVRRGSMLAVGPRYKPALQSGRDDPVVTLSPVRLEASLAQVCSCLHQLDNLDHLF
jgi:hypothetical protein